MTESRSRHEAEHPTEPDIEEVEEDVAEHNPDPITRRESLEQELMEKGRSDEGAEVDLEEDLTHRLPDKRTERE